MRVNFGLFCFSLTCFSLVQAWPFQKRQTDLYAQELQDISKIGTDLTTLNNTLNTFTTDDPIGLLVALQVSTESSQAENDLTAAAGTANSSSPFNSTESGNIATAVLSLEPVIFSTLNNIVTHKPAFATAILFVGDISQTIEQSLIQQRELSREFANALAAKLSSGVAAAAGSVATDIDNGMQIGNRISRKVLELTFPTSSFRNGHRCISKLHRFDLLATTFSLTS